MRNHSIILVISAVFTSCFLWVPVIALSEGIKSFEIVKIKDFLEDAAEFDWNITTANGIKFNNNNAAYGLDRVTNGNLRGFFTKTGEYIDDGKIGSLTYEINPYPLVGFKITEIRGSYFITLPQLKRIQLELNYDLFGNEKNQVNLGEYFIEIYEKNILNPLEWIKTGEIHQYDEMELIEPVISRMGNVEFSSHSFIANLSKWAGREIRLDLVSKTSPDNNSVIKGRWTYVKLMGATFDYKITRDLDEDQGIRIIQTSSNIRKAKIQETSPLAARSRIMLTTYPPTKEGFYDILGLINYNEGFATTITSSTKVAYINSNYAPEWWTKISS